jgi:ADP-ribosylglycohydrolase
MNHIICIGLGHVLGDSIGAQYEFKFNKKREYIRDFVYVPRTISRFQGERCAVLGQFTDDTDMSLTLLRHLQNNSFIYDKDKAIMGYMTWANSRPFGMGKTTKKLLHGIKTVKGYYKRLEKLVEKNDDVLSSQSNGSLMRAWPFTFVDDETSLIKDCEITNNNLINIECSQIYVKMLKDILCDCYVPSSLKSSNIDIQLAIDQARNDIPRTFNKGQSGWVVHALYFAIVASISQLEPLEIYDKIIKMYIDPDTTGAIAGAVIAARFQQKFIDSAKPLLTKILACDTTKGDFSRDDIYHPKTYYNC